MARGLWWLAGLVLLVASGLSVVTYATLDRYQVFDGEYVRNAAFELPGTDWGFDLAGPQDPTAWFSERTGGDIRFERNKAVIENESPKRRVQLRQIIVLNGQHQFELSAKVRTEAVVNGPKPWHTARLDFAGIIGDDRRDHSRFHALFDGGGNTAEREVRGFFDLDPDVTLAQLTLQLSQSTGRFTVSDLSLRPAAYDPHFLTMDKVSRFAWFAFIASVALLFWRGAAHRGAAAGAIALAMFGAAVVLLPAGFREALVDQFGMAGGSEWTSRALHFIGFAALGFLVALARRRERPRQVLPPLLLLAGGAEVLQIVSGGLGLDDVFDLLVNAGGVIVGCGMAEEHIKANYGRRRRKKRRAKVEEPEYQLKQA